MRAVKPRTRLLLGIWLSICCASTSNAAMCQVQDAVYANDRLWALCGRERLYFTSDEAKSWQAVELPPDILYRAIVFLDGQRAFIVGDVGTVLASRDGGMSWSKIEVPTKENLTDVTFVGERGWIVGQNGVVLHSSDGGRTWAVQETKVPQGLASVFFIDQNRGWAVGWMGVILRTRNGGRTWEQVRVGEASWSLSHVYFRDEKNGWIAGMFGQLLRTKDGGETWTRIDVPTNGTVSSVTFTPDGRGWATTNNDVLVSKDGGDKWEPSGINRYLFFKRVVATAKELWAIGTFQMMRWDTTKNGWVLVLNTPSAQT